MGNQNLYSELPPKQYEAPAKKFPLSKPSAYIPGSQRDLAYKPNIPQGWNAPPTSLPADISTLSLLSGQTSFSSPLSSAYNASATLKYALLLDSAQENSSQPAINDDNGKNLQKTAQPDSSNLTVFDSQKNIGRLEDKYNIEIRNFGQTDEEEIVSFTSNKASTSALHLHQSVVDCIAKSPELMVSAAKDNYLQYDNTIKELEASILKSYKHETDPETKNVTHQGISTQDKVQTKDTSSRHNPEDRLIEDESSPAFVEKVQLKSTCRTHENEIFQTDESEQDDDYKKIPVKDLINCFEKQSKQPPERPVVNGKSKSSGEKSKHMAEPSNKLSNNSARENFPIASTISRNNGDFSTVKQQEEIVTHFPIATNDGITCENKGLYVPPEIPLDSYLPPKQSADILPASSYSKPYQQPPIYVETAPPDESSAFPATYQQPIQETTTRFPTSSYPPISPTGLQKKYLNNASSFKVKNASPTPFNPSPLPYDKLAKFDQPSNAYASTIAAPIRKPLAIFPTQVRNTSPTPFGVSPMSPIKTPSYQSTPQMPSPAQVSCQQQASNYYAPPPVRPAEDFTKAPQPYHPPPEDLYYHNNYQPQAVPPMIPPPSTAVDMSQCQNYNTAPRGWNQMKDYYRPIKFGQSKQVAAMPYTDF